MDNKYLKKTSTYHNLSTKMSTYLITESNESYNNLALIFTKIITHRLLQTKRLAFERVKQHGKSNEKQKYLIMYKSMPSDMLMFANHCATIIQSKFKGYKQRKYYNMFKPILRRFKELLSAIVEGWRVRKILKTKYLNKKKIKIIGQMEKKNFREVRILKREMIDQLNVLLKKGKWIQHYKQDKKLKQKYKTKITNTMLRSISLIPQTKNTSRQSMGMKSKSKNKQNNNLKESKVKKYQEQLVQNLIHKDQRQQIAQIPIKSVGFYNIPSAELMKQQTQTGIVKKKQSKKVNLHRKKKEEAEKNTSKNQSAKSTVQPDKQIIQSQKQINKSKSNQKQQKLQIKPIKTQQKLTNNLSLMSLSSPIHTNELDEFTGNKTTKIQSRIIQPVKNQMLQTQKFRKSERKGIKVTLSLNTTTTNIQNKLNHNIPSSSNQANVALDSKSNPKINQTPNPNPKVNLKKMEVQKTKNELEEILEVYKNAYTKKKQQIQKKMNQINKKRKFVQ